MRAKNLVSKAEYGVGPFLRELSGWFLDDAKPTSLLIFEKMCNSFGKRGKCIIWSSSGKKDQSRQDQGNAKHFGAMEVLFQFGQQLEGNGPKGITNLNAIKRQNMHV